MTRASLNGDGDLTFEDPVSRDGWIVWTAGEGTVTFGGDTGDLMHMRSSDAASVGDWLRRTFADVDWRKGVDPVQTSIPLAPGVRPVAPPTADESDKLSAMCRELLESDFAYWFEDPAILYINRILGGALDGDLKPKAPAP